MRSNKRYTLLPAEIFMVEGQEETNKVYEELGAIGFKFLGHHTWVEKKIKVGEVTGTVCIVPPPYATIEHPNDTTVIVDKTALDVDRLNTITPEEVAAFYADAAKVDQEIAETFKALAKFVEGRLKQ